MKYFGTIKSFDTAKGFGEISPEVAGSTIRFETSAIMWDKTVAPTIGQRLSYDVGTNNDRQPRAMNLMTI